VLRLFTILLIFLYYAPKIDGTVNGYLIIIIPEPPKPALALE
jgi:hypothetical protein